MTAICPKCRRHLPRKGLRAYRGSAPLGQRGSLELLCPDCAATAVWESAALESALEGRQSHKHLPTGRGKGR